VQHFACSQQSMSFAVLLFFFSLMDAVFSDTARDTGES
jgi:hypothetical protein